MAWLSDYTYRKKITLKGQTGAGTDYPVLLKVGESSDSTGDDFHIESHSEDFPAAKNDGGDLAFTSSDETTELDFWVEKVEGSGSDKTAWVWIEVSADLGTNKDIYIYYGKSDASNKSNGEDTFIEFDDFDGDSVDTDKWTVTGTVSVSSSIATLDSHERLDGKTDYGYNYALRCLKKDSASGGVTRYSGFGLSADSVEKSVQNVSTYSSGGTRGFNNYRKGGKAAGVQPLGLASDGSDSTNYKPWDIKRFDGKVITILDGSIKQTYTNTTYLPTVDLYPYYASYIQSGTQIMYLDWALLRKCIETEPSFNTVGSEEEEAGVIYHNLRRKLLI